MTRTALRTAGLLAAALLAFGAAGCGGDDGEANAAYVSEVNSIQKRLVSAYQRVASNITTSSTASQDAATLEKLRSSLAVTVAQLRDVDAPGEVSGLHRELASVIDEYGADLTAAADELASGNEERAADARAQLEEETTALRDAFSDKVSEINEQLAG